MPGDRIVGIITPGEGITIYPIQSPALKEFEESRSAGSTCAGTSTRRRRSVFRRASWSQSSTSPAALAQIAQVIAEHDGNIDNISMTRRSPDFTELTIDLEVYDLKHLNAIIAQLRAKKVVAGRAGNG